MVRVSTGSTSGRPPAPRGGRVGTASRGRAATPRPASTRPSEVREVLHLVEPARAPFRPASPRSRIRRLPLIRPTRDEAVGRRSAHVTSVLPASGWSLRQASTNGSCKQRLEVEFRLLAAQEVDAELDLAVDHALQDRVGTLVDDADADVRVLLVEGPDHLGQEVVGCGRDAGDRHLAAAPLARSRAPTAATPRARRAAAAPGQELAADRREVAPAASCARATAPPASPRASAPGGSAPAARGGSARLRPRSCPARPRRRTPRRSSRSTFMLVTHYSFRSLHFTLIAIAPSRFQVSRER